MSTPADPLAAICAYLASTVGSLMTQMPVTGIAGPVGSPAIFRPDIPRGWDQYMPTACIVVRGAGGYQLFGGGSMPVADPRLDVICWGGSQLEAASIARSVTIALKQLGPSVWENTLLQWARVTGPLPMVDADTLWPCNFVSAQVMHAEEQVS